MCPPLQYDTEEFTVLKILVPQLVIFVSNLASHLLTVSLVLPLSEGHSWEIYRT